MNTKTPQADPQPEPAPDTTVTLAGLNAEPAPDSDKDWSSVLIICGGAIPASEKRPVIVAERSIPPVFDKDGAVKEPAKIKQTDYPAGADVYIRSVLDTPMPKTAKEILTWGVNVGVAGAGGCTKTPGLLCTGPAMPAYSAVNLAIQRGATKIELSGLSDWEKDRLQPWFDAKKGQVEGVEITIS